MPKMTDWKARAQAAESALREAREELVKEHEDSNRRVDGIATDYEREYLENQKLREELEQVRELLRRARELIYRERYASSRHAALLQEIEAVLSPASVEEKS